MENLSDELFAQYASEMEAQAQARANGASINAGSSSSYEDIHWIGLEKNRMKLIRAVGGPPNSGLDEFTCRTVRIAQIIADDKHTIRIILPDPAKNPDYILWKIIKRVNQPSWVNKKKVFLVEEQHPDIFNIVNHNGLDRLDKRYIYDKGWSGREMIIMNVIDREQMDWHRANKHTMLLSYDVNEVNGQIYAKEGVPSYGFLQPLNTLFKYYFNWEKYDIGIIKTGLKEAPYRIINASKYFEEVPAELQSLISKNPLTDEERSWERYNLDKIYRVTSYTKIHNRLYGTISKIDSALGTRFAAELTEGVLKEREEFQKQQEAQGKTSMVVEKPISTPTATSPATSTSNHQVASTPSNVTTSSPGASVATGSLARRAPATTGPAFDISLLKGWSALTQEEKDAIKDVIIEGGKIKDILYKDANANLLMCSSCFVKSPDTFVTCPSCGISFV